MTEFLNLSKLKAFEADIVKLTPTFVFHMVENIVGKGENVGNQHFLLFPQCFQTTFSSEASKVTSMCSEIKIVVTTLA